jgi:hypothetical protein
MRVARTLAANDKVVGEAAVNANASKLFAISAARPIACPSNLKPDDPCYAVSALRRVVRNAARKPKKDHH